MIEIYKFEDDLLNTEILKALNFGGFYCNKIGHEYVQLQMLKPTSYLHKFFFFLIVFKIMKIYKKFSQKYNLSYITNIINI